MAQTHNIEIPTSSPAPASALERAAGLELSGDFSELLAQVEAYKPDLDRDLLARAFIFASEAHAGQTRRSGELYIVHPIGTAKIVADLYLDEETLAAALLHDVVEDTGREISDVEDEFGPAIASLVEGVTKLTRIQFQSREQAEAENYRKMILAMAQDVRVILVKLADRLHNMRTIEYLGQEKRIQKARETLDVYAPLAHRFGVQALKWELEDRAFEALHPRKYDELKRMVADRREDRESRAERAGVELKEAFAEAAIRADISWRAKHFYSIYDKMSRRGREFNEIYDLTALRVTIERSGSDGTRDCYAALGTVHQLWQPMPGRFKDYIAMPKANQYRALHTTVIGPDGQPLEIQIRTREMNETAEFGVAAHWMYKKGKKTRPGPDPEWEAWMRQLADWQSEEKDPSEFMRTLKSDLFADEVHVFTPKGALKTMPRGATPIDFAYSIHTDVGHNCVGAKVNGRIVPLHYQLKSGDIVEVLTAKQGRGPSRDWIGVVASSRARNKIRAFFSSENRVETEAKGRASLEQALRSQGLPYRKLVASPLLAAVIREIGFKKAEDFYLAAGSGRVQTSMVVKKLIAKLKTEEGVAPAPLVEPKTKQVSPSGKVGISVSGVDDVLIRLAKCCTPVPGDPILGYISLGKGITIHRADCKNAKALLRQPERFTAVEWEGDVKQAFRVQIAIDCWDRPRLLEDVARTFSECGANIVSYGGNVVDGMAHNWYTAELGDVKTLKTLVTSLRQVEGVFDAYRVTPGG